MADEQIDIDFGDPELNDPQYEQKLTDAEGTGDGTTEEQTADGAAQQGGDESIAPQQPQDQSTGEQTGEGGTPNADGQQQPKPDDKSASPGTKPDKDGNLVDKDGKIVAAAGPERRTYERVQQQDRYIKRLETDLEAAKSVSTQAQVLNGAPEKLGLDMQETQMGLQAIASFKKDPVATARWMLQETMRLGYDLPSIVGKDAQGQMTSGSMDLAAVKSMISEQLQPIIGDREAQQQQSQAQENAQREYDKFVAKHENATIHESAIASLVTRDKTLTPEVAYWQLREYAATNGLDFTKPLGPQVQDRQQGGQQQQTPAPNGNANPQAQNNQQMPMPNGGAPTADMQSGPTLADPDDAWDNIVNQSLREAGMMN